MVVGGLLQATAFIPKGLTVLIRGKGIAEVYGHTVGKN